jgi:hypothetical protein
MPRGSPFTQGHCAKAQLVKIKVWIANETHIVLSDVSREPGAVAILVM